MSKDAPESSRIANMWRRLPFRWAARIPLNAALVFILIVSGIVVCKPGWFGAFNIFTPFGYFIAAVDRSGWYLALDEINSGWIGDLQSSPVPLKVEAFVDHIGLDELSPPPTTLAEEFETSSDPYNSAGSDPAGFFRFGIGVDYAQDWKFAVLLVSQMWVIPSCVLLLWFLDGRPLVQWLRTSRQRQPVSDS